FDRRLVLDDLLHTRKELDRKDMGKAVELHGTSAPHPRVVDGCYVAGTLPNSPPLATVNLAAGRWIDCRSSGTCRNDLVICLRHGSAIQSGPPNVATQP